MKMKFIRHSCHRSKPGSPRVSDKDSVISRLPQPLSGLLLILSLSNVISVASIATFVFGTDESYTLTAEMVSPHWQCLSGEVGPGRVLVRPQANDI